MRAIGAIDIGGTKIAAGVVSEAGQVLNQAECATAPQAGWAAAIQRTAEMLGDTARKAGTDLTGIGVACTGPVDPFTGILGDVGTLPGWQGGNLVAELEGRFGLSVSVENDADAAALAEVRWGAARGSRCFIYITVGTGIGGGIFLSGELYRGVEGAHPELGHQVIDPSGPLCYCGARGCWESLASGPALANWMHTQRPEPADLTAADVCMLARQGDEVALRGVARAGSYLGLGLANLVTLFAPDTVVLGGGLMRSADLLLEPAREVVRKVCTQVPAEKTRLIMTELGAYTGLAGAAAAWLERHR